jgi:hypothetical protein
MSFAHPSYLWAIWGLLVPIAIHLWSKKEAKTIKIGSVQLLSESKSNQSSSIQLNEWWLLLLRMAIISLLTLLMAKPEWTSKVSNSTLTYIIEPELIEHISFMSRFKELGENQEVRLLLEELPLIEDADQINKKSKVQDYWALATETDALQTDSIIVFTNGYAKGLKGARPETKHRINWIVLDSVPSKYTPLIAYKKENELKLFTGISNVGETKIARKSISLGKEYALDSAGDSLVITKTDTQIKVPVVNEKAIHVTLYYSDSLTSDKTYIEAALKTISLYMDRDIKVESRLDSGIDINQETDLTIWLSYKSLSDSSTKILLLKEDPMAHSMIIEGKKDNTFYLTKRITSENAISERLTEKLLNLLDIHKELKELLIDVDNRRVTESELQTTYVANNYKQKQLASWNLNLYLWMILFVLLLIERFVAYKRKQ